MTRRILLGAAVAAAVLVPAPAANAGQLCVKIILTGVVNQSLGHCVNVSAATDCGSHLVQFPPSSALELVYCGPTPIGRPFP